MATLEDKILGEKTHYYCSSSSSEESDIEDDKPEREAGASGLRSTVETELPEPNTWEGTATNTGPKGVIKDWQRFKQLEAEKSAAKERERLALFKKLSLTCRSTLDEEKDKQKEADADEDLDQVLGEDPFLFQYMQQRMNEMLSQASTLPKFGKLIHIEDGQQFLDEIDKENKSVTIIVHIYEENALGCEAMNGCLMCLSQEYIQVKFCKLDCSVAGVSNRFKISGVPALLVYKAGQLVGNFVRLTDEFGDDFFAGDVESFLTEHGMLPDKSCVPAIIKSSTQQDDDDSDLSLE